MIKTFNAKIAKSIAETSFLYVIDCICGVSDSGYTLSTKAEDFEDNFSEDLEAMGITPTSYRISAIGKQYTRMVDKAYSQLTKKYGVKKA